MRLLHETGTKTGMSKAGLVTAANRVQGTEKEIP
jgi:hypothetical protein